jgi:predicted NUDIX family phosphoesterase
MQQKTVPLPQIIIPPSHYEEIFVVPRAQLDNYVTQTGFIKNIDQTFINHLQQKAEFHPRYVMETDEQYKQIIPYLIFKHQNQFFVMERKAQATEKRLASKLSLGIGGHINAKDMSNNTIFSWAEREFHEEVTYKGTFTVTSLGILNDESNVVGKVHLGLVLLLTGNIDQISIKSEHKAGSLQPFNYLETVYEQLEPWSQLLLPELKKIV